VTPGPARDPALRAGSSEGPRGISRGLPALLLRAPASREGLAGHTFTERPATVIPLRGQFRFVS